MKDRSPLIEIYYPSYMLHKLQNVHEHFITKTSHETKNVTQKDKNTQEENQCEYVSSCTASYFGLCFDD